MLGIELPPIIFWETKHWMTYTYYKTLQKTLEDGEINNDKVSSGTFMCIQYLLQGQVNSFPWELSVCYIEG